MAEFRLDTSGRVMMHWPEKPHGPYFEWSDLSPFEQGYVEALFMELSAADWYSGPQLEEIAWQAAQTRPDGCPSRGYCPHCTTDADRPCKRNPKPHALGFSDLAPETLAAIGKDCAANDVPGRFASTALAGEYFWKLRNGDPGLKGFPPLTVTLGDDGRVYLREAAQ